MNQIIPIFANPGQTITLVTQVVREFTSGVSPVQETLPTANGQTVFILSQVPVLSSTVEMFVNGAKQNYGTDYTVDGITVTFLSIPLVSTDIIEFWYLVPYTLGDGYRIDGYVPQVYNIFFPSLSQAANYPQNMTRIDTGLYVHKFTIPNATTSLGTFIANITFIEPSTGTQAWQVFQINVARAFGNVSVSAL